VTLNHPIAIVLSTLSDTLRSITAFSPVSGHVK